MEPEEIYVNLEDLNLSKRPNGAAAGGKPVETVSLAVRETRSFWPLKAATLGLGLLSFLLLTSLVAVSVLYQRDFSQLSRNLSNQTAERNQLLMRHQNLTHERDQLDVRLKTAELHLDQMSRNSVACPAGWRMFGCSCYLLSSSRSIWESSRRQCFTDGADLVTISSREEMVFLNELGAQKFWIGLRQMSHISGWRWTDGSSPETMYWQGQAAPESRYRTQSCAAFNSFWAHQWGTIRSWSTELCSQQLQWVCEKKAASGLL
ncbi:CD209 antigen-like protein C isoform X2 [Fundulus heteroclitus]|uniref:CD209 antigen-like protein C isoform X2 n=1 Tax=Fundulus heteroclitus TaxID=8078 RepID=UPI00165A5387|nr:CD209 antigen-like protein C isoform X2 [Fundulus heteroclitus]